MRGTIDFTGVDESGFPLLPEGVYTFKVSEVAEKTSKNNDPMVMLTLETVVGNERFLVWDYILFPSNDSPAVKAKGRTKLFLKCINEPCGELVNYDTDNWIGKTVKARTYHDMYNGDKKAKIKLYIFENTETKETDDEVPF
jgi:hypothetical protein